MEEVIKSFFIFYIGKNDTNNQELLNENRRLKIELNRKNNEIEGCKKKLNMLQNELNRLVNKNMNNRNANNNRGRGRSTNNIRVNNRINDNIFGFEPFGGLFNFDDFGFGNFMNNIQRINPGFNPGDYEDYYDNNVLPINNRGFNDNNESLEQEVIDQLCPDPDKMTYEQLLELEEKVGKVSKGLTKNQIRKLKHGKYSKRRTKSNDNKCVICQYDFKEGENTTELSCGHVFHSECVDTWLSKNKVCPLCQKEITIR